MSPKFYCYICNEDMTEKVVKQAVVGRLMSRDYVPIQRLEKEKILVLCSKGHKNLFEVPKR